MGVLYRTIENLSRANFSELAQTTKKEYNVCDKKFNKNHGKHMNNKQKLLQRDFSQLSSEAGISEAVIRTHLQRRINQTNSEKNAEKEPEKMGFSTSGLTEATSNWTPQELWDMAFRVQKSTSEREKNRDKRSVLFNLNQPVGIAFFSDLHLGSSATDYVQLKEDTEIVQKTENMFAAFTGDGIDNWISSRMQNLSASQGMPFSAELQLLKNWITMLKGKLLFVVAGNHDNWTKRMSGLDFFVDSLKDTKTLYDTEEIRFNLGFKNGYQWKVKARHKWRYNSVFNATHAIEVGWERGGWDFDVGIGGHTHIGTVCRPFFRHEQKLYALLIGTYKIHDKFGKTIGAPVPYGRGCGVMIFCPDGRTHWCENVHIAAAILNSGAL